MKKHTFVYAKDVPSQYKDLIDSIIEQTSEHLHPVNMVDVGCVDLLVEINKECIAEYLPVDSKVEEDVANIKIMEDENKLAVKLKGWFKRHKIHAIIQIGDEEND